MHALTLSILCLAGALQAAQVTVTPKDGGDEKPILAAIAKLKEAGGGEILIQSGTYIVAHAIELKDVKSVTFRGEPGATLKLVPLEHAETSTDAKAGEKELVVSVHQGLAPGVRLQIHADAGKDTFSGKTKPTFMARLARVEANRLILAEPLPFPVPAKTRIMNEDAPNLFEIRGGCEDITIEGLTIDGGLTDKDPRIPAHAQRCGVFAAGPYNYTDGPTGKAVRHVDVRNCTIRNCFGRGVAFYSVAGSQVLNCTIEDTLEEAVDLDHFVVGAVVRDNRIKHCRVGVELNDANDCMAQNNRIEACETGLTLWRWCKIDDLNRRNRILDNHFIDSAANGMQIQAGTKLNIIRGNTISGTGRNGVSLGASDTTFSDNVIDHTAMNGIFLNGDQNTVSGNRISGSGAGAKQKFAGLRILGAKNQVLDNVVADAVADEGKDNTVRKP